MLVGLTNRLVNKVEKKSLLDTLQMSSSKSLFKQQKSECKSRGSYIPSPETFVYPNKFWKITGLMVIVCLSPFYVGVTIFLSVAYSFETYQRYYNFSTYPYVFTFSVLNACVPLGGVIGSLTFPMMIRNAGKMNIGAVCLVGSIIFCAITLVPFYPVMILGRFLLGAIASWQNTFAAILIKDLTPMQYRALFGGLFFTARCSGITFSCIVAVIFWWQLDDLIIILINLLPVYIALLQWVLLKIFVSQNPADLSRVNEEGLRPYFLKLYSEQNVQKAIQNCVREFKTMESLHSYVNKNRTQQQKQQAARYYNKMLSRILFLSLQVSSVRQIVGVNYITPYAQTLMQTMGCSYRLSLAGPVFINIVQIAASLFGIYLCHKYNRRPLLLLGVAGALSATLIIGFTNLYDNNFGQVGGMIVYMFFVGGMLEPVAWSYAADVLLIVKIPLSNVSSWFSASIIAGTPMRSQIYQLMFAISGFLFVNLIILYFTAIQIKDMTTRQIITQVMEEAYSQVKRKKQVVTELSYIEQKSIEYKKSSFQRSKISKMSSQFPHKRETDKQLTRQIHKNRRETSNINKQKQ